MCAFSKALTHVPSKTLKKDFFSRFNSPQCRIPVLPVISLPGPTLEQLYGVLVAHKSIEISYFSMRAISGRVLLANVGNLLVNDTHLF